MVKHRADKLEARVCVPDLQKERENCPFNQEEITFLLDAGKEKTELRRKLERHFLLDPVFLDPIPPEYLSHEDKYANELRKGVAAVQKLKGDDEVQQLVGQMEGIRMLMGSGLGSAINKDGNPLALHYVMFLPALMGHGTVEQQGYWMTKAWAGQIIGTYAQTELGHGTFLRGLETTATYDESTEEFVLNSPTISSLKWWPGGLGKTANYAVVMAQLYTKSKCHGVHPFIVQLRDNDDHKALPGITIGEIGPRLGMNTNDNGFLGFKNYRIPRNHLLMQHAQVLKNGTYLKPAIEKSAYGTMVFVRVAICFDTCRQLQRAVTIATRYSAVRRQSELLPGRPEPQILDFQTQQYKLLPYISSIFALTFAARYVWDTYNDISGNMKEGILDSLPELHALSCGLKAQSSYDASVGIDICRLACGGHGYIASSNFPRIFTSTSAAQTYEGENTVMWLQVARYIMKTVAQSTKATQDFFQSRQISEDPTFSDLSNSGLLKRWQHSVHCLLRDASDRLQRYSDSGMAHELAWNECSVSLVKCAEAHVRYFTCEQYVKNIHALTGTISAPTLLILQRLCRLYLLFYLEKNSGDMLRYGVILPKELSKLEDEMFELLALLRPSAVSIVDAFDIDDKILDSTLGAWDGNVYERLYEEALKSPLNKTDVPDAIHKYLKPLLMSKL